jgi:hypothetical protein
VERRPAPWGRTALAGLVRPGIRWASAGGHDRYGRGSSRSVASAASSVSSGLTYGLWPYLAA